MNRQACAVHPPQAVGKKRSSCGRKDAAIEVEDHGNGFMLIGTTDLSQGCRVLEEYVEDISGYRFFARVHYNGACAVWATTHPAAVWEGATDHTGEPLKR